MTEKTLTTSSRFLSLALCVSSLFAYTEAYAALALDRTRVVFDGNDKSVSLGVANQNKGLPYLAQAWIEDAQGKKISAPLMALPPVQRIEAESKSQVKVQANAALDQLAQDKESLFYFNLREIPPKSEKENTLQIALQSRIKLFYRPAALRVDPTATPWQEQLTLSRQGDSYVVNNPTPYFVTLSAAAASLNGNSPNGFKPVMIAPKSSAPLGGSAQALGNSPVLTYINDFGGRPKLIFSCNGSNCKVTSSKAG